MVIGKLKDWKTWVRFRGRHGLPMVPGLGPADAARELGVSKQLMNLWIKTGKVDVIRIGNDRGGWNTYVLEESIGGLLEQRKKELDLGKSLRYKSTHATI